QAAIQFLSTALTAAAQVPDYSTAYPRCFQSNPPSPPYFHFHFHFHLTPNPNIFNLRQHSQSNPTLNHTLKLSLTHYFSFSLPPESPSQSVGPPHQYPDLGQNVNRTNIY
ncbi:hypothetical protein E1A91_D07G114900v1, partial [Gossypium mustelinum]